MLLNWTTDSHEVLFYLSSPFSSLLLMSGQLKKEWKERRSENALFSCITWLWIFFTLLLFSLSFLSVKRQWRKKLVLNNHQDVSLLSLLSSTVHYHFCRQAKKEKQRQLLALVEKRKGKCSRFHLFYRFHHFLSYKKNMKDCVSRRGSVNCTLASLEIKPTDLREENMT